MVPASCQTALSDLSPVVLKPVRVVVYNAGVSDLYLRREAGECGPPFTLARAAGAGVGATVDIVARWDANFCNPTCAWDSPCPVDCGRPTATVLKPKTGVEYSWSVQWFRSCVFCPGSVGTATQCRDRKALEDGEYQLTVPVHANEADASAGSYSQVGARKRFSIPTDYDVEVMLQ